MDESLDQVKFRKEHLDALKKRKVNPYPYKFERTHKTEELKENFKSLENKEVAVAGRVMRIRSHGKSTFFDIQDAFGFVQIYLNKDTLSDNYDLVGLLDIGDFIGVKGKLMKTRTGEITILVGSLTVLAKSLHPLPEKWHV
jgi:lysyl-tRNA synthetase class 2